MKDIQLIQRFSEIYKDYLIVTPLVTQISKKHKMFTS